MTWYNSKITYNAFSKFLQCKFSTSVCPQPPGPGPIVTLLDSLGTVGSNLALMLKQNLLIKELRLYDEGGSTTGLVEDLCSIDTHVDVIPFTCKSLRKAIEGAHIVIATGGCQSKPGESLKHLFAQNLDNVRNAAIFLAEFNPKAIFCIAKPPVEALVPMAAEEYKKAETYDPRKIIGVTTPVSMIANTFIGHHLGTDPSNVFCPIIGGMSPKSIVPVISQTKPKVELNSNLYKKMQERIANAEENLLTKGATFCHSKAEAICRFVNLLVKAYHGDQKCAECAFVAQPGHIGEFLPFMTSVVKLGPEGVASTHMPKINDTEISSLKAAVPYIQQNIRMGQTFIHGHFSLPTIKHKRVCDGMLKQKLLECGVNSAVNQYTNQ